jgi:hypothetical protein
MGPKLFYTVTEKELLTIMFGLQKFRTILLGHVVIRTDHYALKCLKQCRLLNHRPTRWSLMLNGFDYEVERIRGKENVVVDTLSRFPPDVDADHLQRQSPDRRCHPNVRETVHHRTV